MVAGTSEGVVVLLAIVLVADRRPSLPVEFEPQLASAITTTTQYPMTRRRSI
jgi:hypothetical protein